MLITSESRFLNAATLLMIDAVYDPFGCTIATVGEAADAPAEPLPDGACPAASVLPAPGPPWEPLSAADSLLAAGSDPPEEGSAST